MKTRHVAIAFVAGAIATFVFHQGGLAVMNALGLTDRARFNMSAT